MSIVTSKEIAKAIKVENYGIIGTLIARFLMNLLKISTINRIYNRNKHKKDLDFLNGILEEFKVRFEIPEEDLKRLPKNGAYITVSNHPLGGIDGILLLKLVREQREDFKIIANFLLQRIQPLEPYILPVNPFENHREIKSSIAGFKKSLQHLKNGHPLGLFPAGEVSTRKEGKLIVDKPWEPAVMKLIQRADVPVVPIYFHAKNSPLFYRLSKLSDTFRTAKLPSELLTQKNRVIKIRIGKPISVKEQKEHATLESFSNFIRRKTYMLSNSFEKAKRLTNISSSLKGTKSPKKIVTPISKQGMLLEVSMLKAEGHHLLTSKNYEVYLAPAAKIPNLLHEIGRLREITFRAIGEGTNKAIDLDKFDHYYHHMFLWDAEAKCLAGAYRMGLGAEIYKAKGIDGFYLQDLFRFEPELHIMMSQSIELGRAFIIKDYQQKPMPLFLLWKGIVHTTLRFPNHKYLIGGVSISNRFSNFSKSLMIEFMKSHYYDPYLAQYITPKKEFKVKLKDVDKDFVFDVTESDLNKFDKFIDEIEPGALRLPVLLKKYIKQNARLIAFNVDPLFNNTVDGLMYIRIADLPDSTVRPVMEEFQTELERKFGPPANSV
jgi:putative hemolysin